MAAIAAAIPEWSQLLRALLESGADKDSWDGAEVNGQGYHSRVAKNVCSLIQAEPGLLSDLVSELESGAAWPKRRICLAALAAVAEHNPALFNTVLDPGLVEEMLVRHGRDAYSFNTRRMSLNALSYLRRVGPGIVPLLLESCRDTEAVQRDAIAAARRFRQVDPAVLPELADALHNPSNRVCYVVAQLLGELGSSRQAMEEEELRAAIAEALAKALGGPSSNREVYGPSPSYSWDSIGVLSEALYDALARVTGAF